MTPRQSADSVPGTMPPGTSPQLESRSSLEQSQPYPSMAAALHQQPRSASPRPPSPASSMIFERNVQESAPPSELSSAIPAHIQTEDHIPPVLEASSFAITDNHLGPDEVEIVTSASHQPASAPMADSAPSAMQSESRLSLAAQEPQHGTIDAAAHQEGDDTASNYGALNPNDPRRLSFISFADVVQAEHAESGSKESFPHSPFASSSLGNVRTQSPLSNRSPSPARSPPSFNSQPQSQGMITPTHNGSGPGSAKGAELSPSRSPSSTAPAESSQQHGDLTIQTMRQALRKTASGDLSVARSHPTSAVGGDEGSLERHPFK